MKLFQSRLFRMTSNCNNIKHRIIEMIASKTLLRFIIRFVHLAFQRPEFEQ